MKSNSILKLSLPIRGMNCKGCAAQIENAIQNLSGVSQVVVDLDTNLANISYDPKLVDLFEFRQALVGAGSFTIPTSEVTLLVQGMSCMSCVAHVEGALGDLPGVVEVSVQLTQGTAQVTFVPEVVSRTQMEQAIQEAGYQTDGSNPDGMDTTGQYEAAQKDPDHPYDASRFGRFKRFLLRD